MKYPYNNSTGIGNITTPEIGTKKTTCRQVLRRLIIMIKVGSQFGASVQKEIDYNGQE